MRWITCRDCSGSGWIVCVLCEDEPPALERCWECGDDRGWECLSCEGQGEYADEGDDDDD